jgi:hypothetical protein
MEYLGTVLRFDQNVALEDAIGSHACSGEVSKCVANSIHLGGPTFLPGDTVIPSKH